MESGDNDGTILGDIRPNSQFIVNYIPSCPSGEESTATGENSSNDNTVDPIDPIDPIEPSVNRNRTDTRSRLLRDLCPMGDKSHSYYDGVCGSNDIVDILKHPSADKKPTPVDPQSFVPSLDQIRATIMTLSQGTVASLEQVQAYLFAKAAGLTTMPSYEDARPNDPITRAEFSKLLVAFLQNVLHREADASRVSICTHYLDVGKNLDDLQQSIYQACVYKVMGLKNDGDTPLVTFDPYGTLTRKDVVTTLDRIINGVLNDNAYPYYTKHMQALYDAGLIKDTSPDIVESRINAFTMMLRIVQNFDALFQ